MDSREPRVTPEEAAAVLNLHALRERAREEDAGYVGVAELGEVLGLDFDETTKLVHEVRLLLPSRLAVSSEVVSVHEAELVIAKQARMATEAATSSVKPTPELLMQVRRREAELAALEKRATSPRPHLRFDNLAGENPHSWAIMWTIVAAIAVVLTVLLLFFRR